MLKKIKTLIGRYIVTIYEHVLIAFFVFSLFVVVMTTIGVLDTSWLDGIGRVGGLLLLMPLLQAVWIILVKGIVRVPKFSIIWEAIRSERSRFGWSVPAFMKNIFSGRLDKRLRLLSRILPAKTRKESFVPRYEEELKDYYEAKRKYRGSNARLWIAFWFIINVVLIILDCYRVAVLGKMLPKRFRQWWLGE